MEVFVVTANCGDYYCGCGVGHLLGVYTDAEKAAQAVEIATGAQQRITVTPVGRTPYEKFYKSWVAVEVIRGTTDEELLPIIEGRRQEWKEK